jgi:hypothetical protein
MSVVAAFFFGRPRGRAPGFRGPSLEPFGRPRLGTSSAMLRLLPDSDEMKCMSLSAMPPVIASAGGQIKYL